MSAAGDRFVCALWLDDDSKQSSQVRLAIRVHALGLTAAR